VRDLAIRICRHLPQRRGTRTDNHLRQAEPNERHPSAATQDDPQSAGSYDAASTAEHPRPRPAGDRCNPSDPSGRYGPQYRRRTHARSKAVAVLVALVAGVVPAAAASADCGSLNERHRAMLAAHCDPRRSRRRQSQRQAASAEKTRTHVMRKASDENASGPDLQAYTAIM